MQQPAEVISMEPPPRKRRRLPVLAIALAVAVMLSGGGVLGYVLLGRDEPADNTEQVRDNCRAAVLERLRSPATAQFVGTETITDNGIRYFVEGEVDSENGFGALLRSEYQCITARNEVAIDEVNVDTR